MIIARISKLCIHCDIFLSLIVLILATRVSATDTFNHLVHEQSPYLRQHMDNPVDWYPWGEEAFQKARDENKPIFLSIGYSTCHWCHVMERESFMDPETAKLLNEYFVSIKIDREERPDIDRVYMTFVQATTGSGGWPMNVWLTPDLKPFFGGTYFPLESKYGYPAFKVILERVASAWENNPEQIEKSARGVLAQLRVISDQVNKNAEMPTFEVLVRGVEDFSRQFDSEYGGFGSAPKFPRPSSLNFMHRFANRQGNESDEGLQLLQMTSETLHAMANGGIYDHIGGGFHRYSVDRFWHIPHFEKMLYDQAQLVIAYLDAFQLTGDQRFAEVARDVLQYVSRDMTASEGGFYSAEDADSLFVIGEPEHGEGVFYVWEKEEIHFLLGDDTELFCYFYGVNTKGNAPSDPQNEFINKNILIRRHTVAEAAVHFEQSEAWVRERLQAARQTLFVAREKRPRPNLDDKILTSWNGLMISAYARAYTVLGEIKYLEAAIESASFIKAHLYSVETRSLVRSYREKPSNIAAFAADYSFLIQGLLDLYHGSLEIQWLQWAESLQEKQNALFWDDTNGGYFASHGNDDTVILRMKEFYDGALPSENAVSALNLMRLAAMLDRDLWKQYANKIISSVSLEARKSPSAIPQMLVSLDFMMQKPRQIVIAGEKDANDTKALLELVYQKFRPHCVLLLADGERGQQYLAEHADFYESVSPINGNAAAYVCENYVCQLPTHDLEKLEKLLR